MTMLMWMQCSWLTCKLTLGVLQAMPRRATKYTPFFMVYGSEAVLPTDLEYWSLLIFGNAIRK